MHRHIYIAFILSIILIGCNKSKTNENKTLWKSQILKVEQDFNDLAQKEGLIIAFETYAAPDGIIKRGGKTIKGRAAITEWYRKDSRPNETLNWKPVFVDVSASGDLAYTYGGAVLTSIDSTGKKIERIGEFHTIWKRQEDGNWKFVWD
jgi:ketosteroid isomerase-like protein